MVDPLGSLSSVITLFKFCIDSFNLIQEVRHHDNESHKLSVRLSIEKCRLYAWGESVGLTQVLTGDEAIALEKCKFIDTVENTLGLILDLLDSSEQKRRKYGCERIHGPGQEVLTSKQDNSLADISASFAGFHVAMVSPHPALRLLKKSRWAIYDKKKFKQMIEEAKDLIDSI